MQNGALTSPAWGESRFVLEKDLTNALDILFKNECYRALLEDHKSKYSILDIALPRLYPLQGWDWHQALFMRLLLNDDRRCP